MNATQLLVMAGMAFIAIYAFRKEIVAALGFLRRHLAMQQDNQQQDDQQQSGNRDAGQENLTMQLDRLTAACQACEILPAVELLRQVAPLVVGHRRSSKSTSHNQGGDS